MGGIAAGGRAPLPRLVGFGHVEGLVVVLLLAVVVVVVLQVTCYLRQPGGERGIIGYSVAQLGCSVAQLVVRWP